MRVYLDVEEHPGVRRQWRDQIAREPSERRIAGRSGGERVDGGHGCGGEGRGEGEISREGTK